MSERSGHINEKNALPVDLQSVKHFPKDMNGREDSSNICLGLHPKDDFQ